MSPLKEGDGDERWNWPKGEEDEDVESAYTTSEEPTVPPTPAEYDEGENWDRAIQRERVSSGFHASVSTSHSLFFPPFFPPSVISGSLEDRMAEYRDPCSLFLGRGQRNAQPPEP